MIATGSPLVEVLVRANCWSEVYPARETQFAVGVACHAGDDSESAGSSDARSGVAELRRVSEVECLGA
jgi:hypothetical protein